MESATTGESTPSLKDVLKEQEDFVIAAGKEKVDVECPLWQFQGNCPKKAYCRFNHTPFQTESGSKPKTLNAGAKQFVPAFGLKKTNQEAPKESEADNASNDSYDFDQEDAETFFEEYQSCKCCQGYALDCHGEACVTLGKCYCMALVEDFGVKQQITK
mmetsp:Transcript_21942/g.24770  ORF Transcript_21942/g.24770 Transcript_21942/m.24770 type:complete len:159 (-) Transcript_21942:233-709(-)